MGKCGKLRFEGGLDGFLEALGVLLGGLWFYVCGLRDLDYLFGILCYFL